MQQEVQFLRRVLVLHRVAQLPQEPQHDHRATHEQDSTGPRLELAHVGQDVHLGLVPHVQQHVEGAVRDPDGHEDDPARATDLLPSHGPSLGQQQQDQHERGLQLEKGSYSSSINDKHPHTHPTEDVEDVADEAQVLVALAMHSELNHVHEDEAERHKLHDDAGGEEAGHRVPLSAHRVHLQRDEHGVDQDEDQVHLEGVLLVVGELEGERNEGRLVRVAVHHPEVVLDVRHTSHVEAGRVEVVPLAGGRVPVARHQRHVPESAEERLSVGDTIGEDEKDLIRQLSGETLDS